MESTTMVAEVEAAMAGAEVVMEVDLTEAAVVAFEVAILEEEGVGMEVCHRTCPRRSPWLSGAGRSCLIARQRCAL